MSFHLFVELSFTAPGSLSQRALAVLSETSCKRVEAGDDQLQGASGIETAAQLI